MQNARYIESARKTEPLKRHLNYMYALQIILDFLFLCLVDYFIYYKE